MATLRFETLQDRAMETSLMTQVRSLPLTRRALGAAVISAVGTASSLPAARAAERRYTFLVLGTDKRSPEEPENTDTIMVSQVDLAAETVRTLSIPRDLYVEIPGYGHGKVNGAFNLAVKADAEQRWEVGAALTVETIAHNFGLDIDGVALTDMQVFPRIVDAVGGITVENPYYLREPNAPGGTEYAAGPVTLDGRLALRYARARSQDGDGGRVMRQHLVLRGLLAKLQDPETLPRIPELMRELRGVVRTDIPTDVRAELLALLSELTQDDLAFTNIDRLLWANYTDAGEWIYQGDWSTLPQYVEDWLAGRAD